MRDVNNFLEPKSICVVGASNNLEKVGGILINKLKKFKGKVFAINPNEVTVQGFNCYSSVLKLKEDIDLVIIAIPAQFVPKVLIECGKKKIQSVIIISAGFLEVGNLKLQKKIDSICKKYKINYLGPNCFGVANIFLNLDTTFSNQTPEKGGISFLSQSGALISYLVDFNKGFSKIVSFGNMQDLDFNDFLKYLIEDKTTKEIICYIEKLKNGKEFIEICQSSKKPIYVLKAGESEVGEKAAISHTASLATDFKIYQGAFLQSGVKQIKGFSKVLNFKNQEIKLKDKPTYIITNAGGAGAIVSDLISFKVKNIFPPIDILGTAKAKNYEEALNKIKNEHCNVVVVLTPQTMSEPLEVAKVLINSNQKKNIIPIFLGDKSVSKATWLLKQKGFYVVNRI